MGLPEAQGLIEFAEADLKAAVADRRADLYLHACIQAQQSAEKALKAVLAAYNRRIPRTHDLAALLESMRGYTGDRSFDEEADGLNQYGSAARYDVRQLQAVDAEEADRAIIMARTLFQMGARTSSGTDPYLLDSPVGAAYGHDGRRNYGWRGTGSLGLSSSVPGRLEEPPVDHQAIH